MEELLRVSCFHSVLPPLVGDGFDPWDNWFWLDCPPFLRVERIAASSHNLGDWIGGDSVLPGRGDHTFSSGGSDLVAGHPSTGRFVAFCGLSCLHSLDRKTLA